MTKGLGLLELADYMGLVTEAVVVRQQGVVRRLAESEEMAELLAGGQEEAVELTEVTEERGE